MFTRKLGRSNIEVSAMGIGCWAIGGPFYKGNRPVGWGDVDDKESILAIQRAVDLGITFFDTSDVYGCGHSEQILGQALHGKRPKIVIATKFGNMFNSQTKQFVGRNTTPEYIRQACEDSLRRLRTDYIDLYQLHINSYDPNKARDVLEVLENLVASGKIRYYGWSTDYPENAKIFAQGPHCIAIQHRLNVFEDNKEMLALCERFNLASVNRGPLARGLLSGKFNRNSKLPANDLRCKWNFREGEIADRLQKLESIRDVLSSNGRTLVQGALSWIWARSEKTIPIPGVKTVKQVEENVGALQFGPLTDEQMKQIEMLLREQT
jgi:aryl-alcohol dehydrogenase-like predicted oxidoreductase